MKTYQIYLGYGKNVESVDVFFYIGRDEAENKQQAVLNVYDNIEPFVEENGIFKVTEEGEQNYSYYTFSPNLKEVEK